MLQPEAMTSYYPRTSSSASLSTPPTTYADEQQHRDSAAGRNHQSGGGARSYSYTSYRESLNSRSPKKKMTNTVRASNKAAILAVGEELRLLLHEEEPPLIKDRRYHLKAYEKCFIGSEMVDWLLKKGEVESRSEAVAMMQKLLDNGVVHHVCDDHAYKDEKLFYRFRKDDGSYVEPADSAILAKGQRLYSRLKGDGSNLVQDRKYHFTTYKQCFVGKEFVDWLLANNEASSRPEAIDIGRKLLEAGVFRHVCDDHHFKDEGLFFRFKNDEKQGKSPKLRERLNSKKGSKYKDHREEDAGSTGDQNEHRESGGSWDSSVASDPHTPQGTPDLDEYVHMQSSSGHIAPSSAPQQHSPSAISNSYPSSMSSSASSASPHLEQRPTSSSVSTTATRVKPTVDDLIDPAGRFYKKAVNVVSDPVGYGFVIRGSRPVYVHTIDPSGPAASAGLKVGDYLYSVNGQVVLNASHTDAARIILMGSSTAALVVFTERTS